MTTSYLQSDQHRFGFKLEFVRDSENPSRVFSTFLKLIDFCKTTDKYLLDALDADIEPAFVLSDIEEGSISVWFKNVFKLQEDIRSDLNLDSVSGFLIQAKRVIVAFLRERNTISKPSEISKLQKELLQLSTGVENSRLLVYAPLSQKDLLSSIDKYQSAINELQPGDKLSYLYENSQLPLNTNFNIVADVRDELLTKETKVTQSEMILKIKKPDYLGESKWEFKYDKKIIEAKVDDLEWVEKFRNKEIAIQPGDAIKAIVEITTKYDADYKVFSIKYSILHVTEIIATPVYKETPLFDDIHEPD
ncbi:hypothetical protein PN499_21610 [Kamptonema animale CS-326]|uniref:hypothetical protein n=1 Tax=Kamptonema animale TaxID=92934 RepID=UPI002330095F|nr:hypothetical protein [Kamptonema animale]MDB9513799.1 hypothetical protein [Kamptonema animale CS-326]